MTANANGSEVKYVEKLIPSFIFSFFYIQKYEWYNFSGCWRNFLFIYLFIFFLHVKRVLAKEQLKYVEK